MLEILNNICAGKGQPEDVDILIELGQHVSKSSLCGLGQTAPNPVLTTIRYFRDEYEDHILNKACPAKVCKALISYSILPEKCTGCTLCMTSCPAHAITGVLKSTHTINPVLCTRCGMCSSVCKFDAIQVN